MKAGWIKISRSIAEHWLWKDAEILKWWLDLLLMAAWKEHKELVGRQLVSLEKGQLIASLAYLCKRWKRSRPMVECFISNLEQDGMITKAVCNNISIITIANYECYQTTNDAYLDAYQTDCESSGYIDGDTTPYAHLDVDPNADLDTTECTTPYAYPYATNRRIVKNSNNILKKENIKERKEVDSQNSPTFVATATQKVDYSKLLEFFNQTISESGSVIKEIRQLTDRRKLAIQARARENGKESLMEVIKQAAKSDFLNGRNDRGWVADFDWLMRPNNFVKVLEGNYNNNGNDRRRGTEVTAAKPEDYDTTF